MNKENLDLERQKLIEELRYALPTTKILNKVSCAAFKLGSEYIVLKERPGAEFKEENAVVFSKNLGYTYEYSELQGLTVILGSTMFNRRGLEAIATYKRAKEQLLSQKDAETLEDKLWIGIVRIFDTKESGAWRTGTAYKVHCVSRFTSKRDAESYVETVVERYEKLNEKRGIHEKCRISSCVVSYDNGDRENVEEFFEDLRG